MKDFLLKIIRQRFCLKKRNILKEIVNIEFNDISKKYLELNCFNSNDLWLFIDERNEHFRGFFIKDAQNEDLNFLMIDSISESKSKSSGYRFDTIYSFGKNLVIDRKKNWDFESCIKHIEEEYKTKSCNIEENMKMSLQLCHHKWNDRYEFNNFSGSHHLAVANFIATNNGYEYTFNCDIESISINKDVANKLLDNYEMFVFNTSISILKNIFNEDGTEIIKIQDEHIMVLFDKDKSKNKGYINLLKLIDKKYTLYFNEYLESRLKYQDTYLKKKAINGDN